MPVQPPPRDSLTTTPPRQTARAPRFWPEHRYIITWAALAAVIPLTAILVLTFSNEEESAAGGGSETSAASEPESSSSAAPSGEGVTTTEDIFGPACAQAPTEGEGSAQGMVNDPVGTAASNIPMLSTLTKAVMAANLVDTLNDLSAQYTVFAPKNSAFAELEASQPGFTDTLLPDPKGQLTAVLTYHVIPKRYDAQGLVDAGSVTSAQGGMVEITGTPDAPLVNGNEVLCGNIPTANATVFVIDSVLMPPAA